MAAPGEDVEKAVGEVMTAMPVGDQLKDKLISKRFVTPATAMGLIYLLCKDIPDLIAMGCYLIAALGFVVLIAEVVLKLRGLWGKKEKAAA